MSIEKQSFQILRDNANKLYTQFGFLQRRMYLFRQINFALQFFCIFAFKASLFSPLYNGSIHLYSNEIVSLFVNKLFLALLNFIILLPFIFFAGWSVLQIRQKNMHEFHSSCISPLNIKTLAVYSMLVVDIITVPCIAASIRQIYLTVTDPVTHLNLALLILTCISLCFSCTSVLLDSSGMLLGSITFPVIFCLIGPQWNILILSGAGLLLVLSQLEFKKLLCSSSTRLTTAYKLLLVFIFALDVFTSSISNTFFILYMLVISLVPMVSPGPEFIEDNIEVNNYILNVLQIMKKDKEISKNTEYKILKEVFRYKNEHKTSMNSQSHIQKPFKLANPLTYENLTQFFKIKIAEDIQLYKHQITYKLQYFLFEIKHHEISFDTLSQITSLSQQTRKNFKIGPKIILLDIQRQIDQIFKRKDDSFNLEKIINVCTQIEITNEHLDCMLDQIIRFWSLLEKGQLSQKQLFEIMKLTEKKQERIKSTIKYLQQYPNLNTQAKLYNYSLKLFDFEYQAEQNIQTLNSVRLISSTCYVILAQNKIVNISSQMLLELRKKKHQVINRSLESLLPEQIVSCIESQFTDNFQLNTVHKRLLPFIDIRNKIVPYYVELETVFSLESGIQQVINFVRSSEVQQVPLFFYQLSTDRILFTNQLFVSYIRCKGIKMDNRVMGYDLFSSELSSLLSNSKLKIKDTLFCTLTSQSSNETHQTVNLKVVQIYKDKNKKYILLAIQNNDKIAELAEKTHFSMINFLSEKNNKEKRLSNIKSGSSEKVYKNEQIFCPILNPYESHIDESLMKLKIDCRMGYLKVILLLMILLVLISISIMVWVIVSANQFNTRVNETFHLALERQTAIESSYEMLYLYYRYYQIKVYPEGLMKISNFNMTYLTNRYYDMTSSNLTTVLLSIRKQFAVTQNNYTIKYNSFNQTTTTTPDSLIDFLADIKYALDSNNPQFSVRNQPNLDTILSSYQTISLDYLSGQVNKCFYGLVIGVAFLIIIAIIIKVLSYRIESLSKDVTQILEKMPIQVIKQQRRKYRELKMVTQHCVPQVQTQLQPKNEGNPVVDMNEQSHRKIIRKPFMQFLMSNNIILFIFSGTVIFLIWNKILLNSYEINVNKAYNKYMFLLDTQTNITIPAEKFYQAAMEQILPPNQKTPYISTLFTHVDTDFLSFPLSDYFRDYTNLQNKLLSNNLCDQIHFLPGQIYLQLNCSLVLNGIVTKTYPEIFSQYKALARNYTGTGISKLGEVYRFGAAYPVYMEICFLRRVTNIAINSLKVDFQNRIPGFIDSQSNKIISVILNGIYMFPLVIVVMGLEFKRLRQEADATIKAFKIIPKEYLLRMKVTKFIKNQNILEKMESF